MRFKCLECHGYKLAIRGAMLSKGVVSYDNFRDYNAWDSDYDKLEFRCDDLANRLSGADGGHNKFLEQIQYWIVIDAPLYFWKQFDTYRIGVSKSSESTMFRMWKGGIKQEDFEHPIYEETLKRLNEDIEKQIENNDKDLFYEIINNLPDGYLQTRLVNINAKSLRNIYQQRAHHKLKEWREFCKFIETLPHGSLITKENVKMEH